jgi:hypothetical protein
MKLTSVLLIDLHLSVWLHISVVKNTKMKNSNGILSTLRFQGNWGWLLHKNTGDVRGSITRYRDFTNSILHFDRRFAEKKNLCPMEPLCLTGEHKQPPGNCNITETKIWCWRSSISVWIVAIDKMWIRNFEPELKLQSNEWRSQTSPWTKIVQREQSKVKKIIFACDHRGIIMTGRFSHGTSVTGCKNWAEKCTKTDLTSVGLGHSFCTTMLAHILGRLSPIC